MSQTNKRWFNETSATYSLDELKQAVKSSVTYGEITTKVGLYINGPNIRNIKLKIQSFNIDVSHIKEFPNRSPKNSFSMEDFLSNKIPIGKSYTRFKRKLISDGYLKNECYICGIKNIWNGKKLTLQVDHIDGNSDNNLIENLRILCPNCHSQTETFCRGHNRIN